MEKRKDIVTELNELYDEIILLTHFTNKHLDGKTLPQPEIKQASLLHENIGRKVGYLRYIIAELSGIDMMDVGGIDYDVWLVALKTPLDKIGVRALSICREATNRAIGKLTDDINKGKRDKQTGELIDNSTIPKSDPIKTSIFDSMQLHPKVVEVSRQLFLDSHYAQSILEACKAVELAVRNKSGMRITGKNLMAQVFNEQNPKIRVLESGEYIPEVQRVSNFSSWVLCWQSEIPKRIFRLPRPTPI